jgi:SMP-30/Gluconolactonase/LRE-like region
MRWTIVVLVVALASACARQPSLLHVGPGPEDMVLASWPDAAGASSEVVVTSLAARRRCDDSPKAKGFLFIGLRDGRPEMLSEVPQVPKGAEQLGPWQGLYWQPHGAFAGGRGVLAATRTSRWRPRTLWFSKFNYVGGAVDFFTWSADHPRGAPALERLPIDVPTLTDGRVNFNFNAVALASDGTLYASVMSLGGGPAVVVDPPREHAPEAAVERGALYVWRPGWPAWRLVVEELAGANGIALSADESRLFVNSAGSHRMLEFQREADGRLAAQYVTHMLPLGSAPDNLKLVSDGRLVATGTPCGVQTGLYLLFENCLGVSLGASPRGIAWVWSPTDGRPDGVELLRWPRTFVGPSTTVRLGDWWLGSQMVDDGIAYRPVAGP